jgi:hypothetical protein
MLRETMWLPVLEAAHPADAAPDGWERRFAALPPRLDEMSELYRALGFEVRLEPVGRDELPEQCGECPTALALARVLYTRRRP